MQICKTLIHQSLQPKEICSGPLGWSTRTSKASKLSAALTPGWIFTASLTIAFSIVVWHGSQDVISPWLAAHDDMLVARHAAYQAHQCRHNKASSHMFIMQQQQQNIVLLMCVMYCSVVTQDQLWQHCCFAQMYSVTCWTTMTDLDNCYDSITSK